jgi:hypothetical protein
MPDDVHIATRGVELSDVDVEHRRNGFWCLSCGIIAADHDFFCTRSSEMIEHLDAHQRKGFVVPPSAYRALHRSGERS